MPKNQKRIVSRYVKCVKISLLYKQDSSYLTPLLSQLKELEVTKPPDLIETKVKDDKGNETTFVTKFNKMVFQEKVKEWIKNMNSLKATSQSLYNIIWGKCSKLIQNKLIVVEHFEDDIKVNGDVTKLLKEMRGVSHQMESNTSVYDAVDKAKIRYYEYS